MKGTTAANVFKVPRARAEPVRRGGGEPAPTLSISRAVPGWHLARRPLMASRAPSPAGIPRA
eukprot:4907069-Prymnesium_polylepis.1